MCYCKNEETLSRVSFFYYLKLMLKDNVINENINKITTLSVIIGQIWYRDAMISLFYCDKIVICWIRMSK